MHHYSIFELFSIGIGPSSSHTVGPMRAAHRFLEQIRHSPRLVEISGIRCECYGSLAATGHGHGTDTAIMLGLLGEEPHTVEPRSIPGKIARLRYFIPRGAGSSLPNRNFCIRKKGIGKPFLFLMNPRRNCCTWLMSADALFLPLSWRTNAPCSRNGKSVKNWT